MKIITDRLVIRSFRFGDEKDLYEMCSDKETAYDAGWKPHKSLSISKNVCLGYIYGSETFAITLKDIDKVIGTISLYDNNFRNSTGAKELGFCLNKEYRNKGIMNEAVAAMLDYGFRKLKTPLIWVCCHTKNIRCKNLIEKYPFEYEGLIKSYRKLFNDDIVDVYMYSLSREDYLKENE